MSATGAVRRVPLLFAVCALVFGSTAVPLAGVAEAAVVRPFTLNYDKEVYGDFLEAGNGSVTCPGATDPTDPFGEPKTTCPTSQAGTATAAANINDSYYMRWSDVDTRSRCPTGSRSSTPPARAGRARSTGRP